MLKIKEKTTINALLETGIAGLTNVFLTEQDKENLRDFILKHSTCSVSEKHLNISAGTMLGISEGNANSEIPLFPILTFYFAEFDPRTQPLYNELGLSTREWNLENHYNLEILENYLTLDEEHDCNSPKGEVVVLINGKPQQYRIGKTMGALGMPSKQVDWENFEPYEVSYTAEGKRESEYFGSRAEVEPRVIELAEEGAKEIRVQETVSQRALGFRVTQTISDSSSPFLEGALVFEWNTWSIDEDYEAELTYSTNALIRGI